MIIVTYLYTAQTEEWNALCASTSSVNGRTSGPGLAHKTFNYFT